MKLVLYSVLSAVNVLIVYFRAVYWFGIKLATVKPFKYEKKVEAIMAKEKGRF